MAAPERRLDVRPIERRYLRGLQRPSTQRITWGTRVALFLLPVLAGACLAALFPMVDPATGGAVGNPLIPAVGLGGAMMGGMLAGFVLTLNLRLKLEENGAVPTSRATRENLTYAAYTFLHLTLCCMVVLTIALPMAMCWTQWAPTAAGAFALRLGIGVCAATLIHVLMNAVTLVRRIGSAYAALFDTDMRSTFRVVRDEDRSA